MTGQAVSTYSEGRARSLRAALLDPSSSVPLWLKNSLAALTAPYRVIPAASALTEATRKVVQEMRSRLDDHLQPASVDTIATGLAMIQAQFVSSEVDEVTAKIRIQGYLLALEGVPAFALDEAAKRILQRKLPGLNPRFMPTAPELRDLIDEIARPAKWHAAQLRLLLDAKVDAPADRVSPERAAEIYELAVAALPKARKRHPGNPSGVNHADKDTAWH